MLDALKTLFENDVVLEEVRPKLKTLGKQKSKENKQTVTAELPKNLLKSMNMINPTMVDAIDAMLPQSV